jgi:predicted nucleic acid-binding protein
VVPRHVLWPSGAARGSRAKSRRFSGRLTCCRFEAPADVIYGRLRTDLERRGQPMGGNDLLIVAHALAA